MKINRRSFLKLSSITVAGMPVLQLPESIGSPAPADVGSDTLYRAFEDPPVAARPFVRWWWNGNRVIKEELLRELDLLKSAGIGGVEINAIEFPETADPMNNKPMDWLSDEWTGMLQAAVQGVRERGMISDIIVGSGWPFGGEFLGPDEQTRMVTIGTRNLKGPQRLEIASADLLKEVEPPIMSKRAGKTKELVSLRLARAQMDKFDPGTSLNDQLGSEKVTIEVPPGDHVLYSVVKLVGFESVIHGAPGADGPVLNHYHKGAVERYLNRMSDAIEARLGLLGKSFRSLFVDSMELEGANWCDDMPEQFARRRGYSLEPYLPYILFKTGRMGRPLAEEYGTRFSGEAQDTVNRVRHDFETTKLEIFRERFFETFLTWCRKHGVQSRVQAYGREYHPLNSSLLLDIPDCETWIRPHTGEPLKDQDFSTGRTYTQVNKNVSSAAHLSGKSLVSCEELTNTQVVFNATLEKLKITADQSNLSGVTHSILHGFNYSPKDAPFPGWVRYGTFFNERNPWWPYLKKLTDYKARLSTVFQNSKFYADIAVMHPLADMWSKHGIPWDPNPERAYPPYVFNVWEAIHQSGYACDYVSEQVLQHSAASKGELHYGPRSYKTLLLIEVESVQPETAEAIRRFADAGGRIIFVGKQPHLAPGLRDHERRDKAVSDVIQSIVQKHSRNVITHPAPDLSATSMLGWFKGLTERMKLRPYMRIENPVSSVSQIRYTTSGADIFFICNSSGTETYDFEAAFATTKKTPWLWDPETGDRCLYPHRGNRLRISLAPAESRLIVFDDEPKHGREYNPAPSIANRSKLVEGPWEVHLEHVDGSQRSLTMPALKDFKDEADLKSFAGIIRYQTRINLDSTAVAGHLDLGKVHGVSEVILNGRSLGAKWYGRHAYDISTAANAGSNALQVKVTTTLGNYMKSLPNNKDGVKWTKKQPLNPVGMLGPVELKLKT